MRRSVASESEALALFARVTVERAAPFRVHPDEPASRPVVVEGVTARDGPGFGR
jgi:hypothetical protein